MNLNLAPIKARHGADQASVASTGALPSGYEKWAHIHRGDLISEVERLCAELQAVKEENEDLRESATVHEARADEWADRFYELESEIEEANLRAEMGCENPPDDCECPGCTAAAEHNARIESNRATVRTFK